MQVVATAQTGGGGSARGLLGKERAPLRALSRRGALHGAPPVRQQLQDPGSQQIVVLGARHSEKPAGGDLLALYRSSYEVDHPGEQLHALLAVSYTHLTLPT